MDDPFEWAKKFDEWSKDKKDSKEIIKIMQAIHLLMDGCSHNLNTAQLTKIQKRMKTTIKQCIFWRDQNNLKRFITVLNISEVSHKTLSSLRCLTWWPKWTTE